MRVYLVACRRDTRKQLVILVSGFRAEFKFLCLSSAYSMSHSHLGDDIVNVNFPHVLYLILAYVIFGEQNFVDSMDF